MNPSSSPGSALLTMYGFSWLQSLKDGVLPVSPTPRFRDGPLQTVMEGRLWVCNCGGVIIITLMMKPFCSTEAQSGDSGGMDRL